MRSLVPLAVAAASLLASVAAEAQAGVVQLDFRKEKREASSGQLRRRQTSNTANAQITNYQILYLINTTIGTPGQSIGLQLDTGSSDIWFPSSSASICRARQCIVGSYNQAASSSYSNPGYGTFQIQYVDGTEIEGQYISDTISVAGVTVTNQTMASASQVGENYYGIMGVGFPSDESANQPPNAFTYPNIIDSLVSQGKINKRAYSLWLDDLAANTGSILFGGVDKSKYTGGLVAIPIQKSQDSGSYTSFTVAWTGLTVSGGGQTSNLSPSSPQPAILDSGTTELYLPDSIVSNIYNGLGVVTNNVYGNIVPCDYANDNLTFAFQFGGSNGPVVNVALSEFILPIETSSGRVPKFSSGPYNGRTACNLGIEAAGQDPILFGDTFLRSAYVVYDLDALQIGLAQANTNGQPSEQSVSAFASSGAMPDATATITGVTVEETGNPYNGPNLQTSATATGDIGTEATTRTATFSLVKGTGASSSSSSGAATPLTIPSIERSTIAAIGSMVAAFFLGTMLL
ncbi:hypothetical protein R6Q59_010106 [Mikania micrantha]